MIKKFVLVLTCLNVVEFRAPEVLLNLLQVQLLCSFILKAYFIELSTHRLLSPLMLSGPTVLQNFKHFEFNEPYNCERNYCHKQPEGLKHRR